MLVRPSSVRCPVHPREPLKLVWVIYLAEIGIAGLVFVWSVYRADRVWALGVDADSTILARCWVSTYSITIPRHAATGDILLNRTGQDRSALNLTACGAERRLITASHHHSVRASNPSNYVCMEYVWSEEPIVVLYGVCFVLCCVNHAQELHYVWLPIVRTRSGQLRLYRRVYCIEH